MYVNQCANKTLALAMPIVLVDNINRCANVIPDLTEIPMLNVYNETLNDPNVPPTPIVHHVTPVSMNGVRTHAPNLTFVIQIRHATYWTHIHYAPLLVDVPVI